MCNHLLDKLDHSILVFYPHSQNVENNINRDITISGYQVGYTNS